MSQAIQIRDHIKRHGFITPIVAFAEYGCLALHSRAAELRDMGEDIVCTIRTSGRKRWGEYAYRQAELSL